MVCQFSILQKTIGMSGAIDCVYEWEFTETTH